VLRRAFRSMYAVIWRGLSGFLSSIGRVIAERIKKTAKEVGSRRNDKEK